MSDPPTPSADLAHWLASQRELTLLLAHDLRNPLAAVLANVNFLELAIRPEETDVLEAVGDVKTSAETLLRMIENVVTIARLEAEGPPQLRLEPVDVASVARAMIDRVLPAARGAGVALTLDVRAEPAYAQTDASLVEQLIENLASNAVQHVRRGRKATLTIDRGDDGVRIALDDEGPPFGPIERDFTRDGQLEMKKKPDARYSRGLALYVAGLAARALGGALTVRSDDGLGHVAVVLPARG